MSIKEKVLQMIERIEKEHDFEDEFYLTFTGQINDGDISDWHINHFDDNVELGFVTGQTNMAENVIVELKKIISEEE